MEEVLLADKYAKALIAVASEANLIDQLDIELIMFAGILKKQANLCEVFLSPVISLKEKKGLLQAIFIGGWVSPELKNFLYLLMEKRRFNLFDQICRIYGDLIYSLRKRIKVFAESAFALDAKQKKALKDRLAKIYQRNIDLFVRLNPELIGGAKIYLGHTLFDGTLKRRLSLMQERICRV